MIHTIAHLLGIKLEGSECSAEIEKKVVEQLEKVPYIQYPTAFHTVDIIATREGELGFELLLGRKHKSTEWVFIGGFVEPKQTAESAALRELHEETNILIENESRLVYLGSHFIDDARYKDSCHKISTSLFTIQLTAEEAAQAKGGDDISETKWLKFGEIEVNLKDHHRVLLYKFLTSTSKWHHSHNL